MKITFEGEGDLDGGGRELGEEQDKDQQKRDGWQAGPFGRALYRSRWSEAPTFSARCESAVGPLAVSQRDRLNTLRNRKRLRLAANRGDETGSLRVEARGH